MCPPSLALHRYRLLNVAIGPWFVWGYRTTYVENGHGLITHSAETRYTRSLEGTGSRWPHWHHMLYRVEETVNLFFSTSLSTTVWVFLHISRV
jgi:hypothetical protein